MKKISVLIPTYNEEENVKPLAEAIIAEFEKNLLNYNYEIIFIDNFSNDKTRDCLKDMCAKNTRIKAILNAKNFGPCNSHYHGMQQTTGDCTILMCADFQEPIDMIPKFVAEWEKGHQIVIGQKTTSRENKIMYFIRSCYYKIIKKFSEVEQIEHFTGFGLYDKSFIEVMKKLNDSTPFLRGIVAEFGSKIIRIPYEQQKRRAGKTKNNFYILYDVAMLSFTSYTKIGLRLATFVGFGIAVLSTIIAVVYLILKLIYWNNFMAGMAPILIGMFLLGAIQLIFIGLMGEYIMSMNTRIMNRPLVIEEERLNFYSDEKENKENYEKNN